MNEESRKKKTKNIQNNCGNCIHAKICSYKDTYDSAVSRIIHEAQADSFLIEVLCKCKYHSEQIGYQSKPDGTFGYQPVNKSTTLTSPPMTGSKVVEPRFRMFNGITTISYGDLRNYIQEEKSEAVKEFAEKLKNEINIRTTYSREQDKNVMRMIDNLVKEMTEMEINQRKEDEGK